MKEQKSIFSKTSQRYYSNILSGTRLPSNDSANWGNRLNSLNKLAKKFAPKKLFRFRRFSENSLKELADEKIYLPTPTDFNDVFDTYINFDKDKLIDYVAESIKPENMENYLRSKNHINPILPTEICDKIAEAGADMDMEVYSSKIYTEFMESVKENADLIVSSIRKTIVCTCFSEDILSTYMWGQYAEDSKGFAIEYNIDEHVFGVRKVFVDESHYGFFSLLPIIYSDVNPCNNEFANQMLMGLCAPHLIEYFKTSDYLWKTKIALYKSTEWDKEKEWRIVSTFEDINDYNSIKNLSAKFPYPPKAVYLGNAMDIKNKLEVLKISNDKEIKAYDIVPDSPSTFSLTYKEINISESLSKNMMVYK